LHRLSALQRAERFASAFNLRHGIDVGGGSP
jgi:hypothetical protein